MTSIEERKPNLYHQIRVWKKLNITVHFIPTQKNAQGAALYHETKERGHVTREACDRSIAAKACGAP